MAERLRLVVLDAEMAGPRRAVADDRGEDQEPPVEQHDGGDQAGEGQHGAGVVDCPCARVAMGAQVAQPEIPVGHSRSSSRSISYATICAGVPPTSSTMGRSSSPGSSSASNWLSSRVAGM